MAQAGVRGESAVSQIILTRLGPSLTLLVPLQIYKLWSRLLALPRWHRYVVHRQTVYGAWCCAPSACRSVFGVYHRLPACAGIPTSAGSPYEAGATSSVEIYSIILVTHPRWCWWWALPQRYVYIAVLCRDEIHHDYVRTARAKGAWNTGFGCSCVVCARFRCHRSDGKLASFINRCIFDWAFPLGFLALRGNYYCGWA